MSDKIFTILAIIIVVVLFFMGKRAIDKGELKLYYTDENETSNNIILDTSYSDNNMTLNEVLVEE